VPYAEKGWVGIQQFAAPLRQSCNAATKCLLKPFGIVATIFSHS
jgi:hypothetical protein